MSTITTGAITGDVPASVELISLLRTDTNQTPAGVSLPAAMTQVGSAWNYKFADPASGLLYTGVYQINWPDGSFNQVPFGISAGANSPDQTLASLFTYDGQGNIQPNVPISFRLIGPPGIGGAAYPCDPFEVVSDANGALSTNLLRKSKYEGWRVSGHAITFTTPDSSTYQLPEIIGKDAG